MNEERTYERDLRDWLEAGPTQAPDRTVEAVLLTVANTTQERGRWVPWRKPRMIGFVRAAAIAAVGARPSSPCPSSSIDRAQPAAVAPPPLPPTACPVANAARASGSIATIAGTGVSGYSGDGGLATGAIIRTWVSTTGFYGGLTVGPTGDLYFADTVGQAVRRIDTNGVITTVAGPSTGAPLCISRWPGIQRCGRLVHRRSGRRSHLEAGAFRHHQLGGRHRHIGFERQRRTSHRRPDPSRRHRLRSWRRPVSR